MTSEKRLDSVGWVFFGVMLVVFLPLGIYLVLNVTYDTIHIVVRVGTGVFLGVFAAGFTSWVANSILYFRAQRLEARAAEAKRQEQQARKKAKKQRK